MKNRPALVLTLSSALFLGACATGGLTGESYSRQDTRQVQQVEFGHVLSARPVIIEGNKDSAIGSVSGGVIGGIAGNSVGDGRGRVLATAVGAIVGGIVGQKVEANVSRKQGQEISIRMESGETISVVQEVKDDRFFQAGDRVRLLELNGITRVTYL